MRYVHLAHVLLISGLLFSYSSGVRSAQPQAPDLCGGRPCIQIGTFNVEWLGTKMRSRRENGEQSSLPLRSRKAVNQIARLIAETLDLEIVVLEEINTSIDEKRDGQLFASSRRYQWLTEALAQHGYRLMAGTSGGTQRVVIAYDADEVELIGDAAKELEVRADFDLGNGCTSRGLRLPLAAQFRAGQFDFVLIGVHLKSQRGGDCADAVRQAQCDDLRQAVAQLLASSTEKDMILVGDFNATLADPSLGPLLQTAGFEALTASGRRASGSSSISFLMAPFRSNIDHLLVQLESTTEWVNKTTIIFTPPPDPEGRKKYTDFISDHAPVWASFRTDVDDDP